MPASVSDHTKRTPWTRFYFFAIAKSLFVRWLVSNRKRFGHNSIVVRIFYVREAQTNDACSHVHKDLSAFAEGRTYISRFDTLSAEEKSKLRKLISRANLCCVFTSTREELMDAYDFLALAKSNIPNEYLSEKSKKRETPVVVAVLAAMWLFSFGSTL